MPGADGEDAEQWVWVNAAGEIIGQAVHDFGFVVVDTAEGPAWLPLGSGGFSGDFPEFYYLDSTDCSGAEYMLYPRTRYAMPQVFGGNDDAR